MASQVATFQSKLKSGWRRQQMIVQIFLYIGLSIVGIFILFPFYYMIISSLREPFYNFDRTALDILPSALNFQSYARVFNATIPGIDASGAGVLVIGFKNTFILEVAIVVTSTILNALAAYVFAKRNFPGKQLLFTLLLATIILPGEVTLIPRYLMFRDFKILNTFWALILPSLTSIFGIFLMRQFMLSIPNEYLEAARLDGANELQVVLSIIFPLSVPVMSTYALMTFLGVWNDLMGPLLYCDTPPTNWTLQLALYNLYSPTQFQYGSSYQDPTGLRMQILFAGLIISALPTFIVYVIFQKRLVQGIVLTGLKG